MVRSTTVFASYSGSLPTFLIFLTLAASPLLPSVSLAADAGQPQPPRVDALGDPLPAGAIGRLGSTRFRHGRDIRAIAWSPDGTRIVSAGSWCTRMWQADTGKELFTGTHNHNAATRVVFSPDGKLFVTAMHDSTVLIRDAATGKVLHKLQQRGRYLAVDPSGRVLAVSGGDGQVAVFDLDSGQRLEPVRLAEDAIRCLAFSLDGKRLMVVTMKGEVAAAPWQGESGAEPQRLKMSDGTPATRAVFSPDRQFVALAAEDKNIFVCRTDSGERVSKFTGHDGAVTALAFSPNGQNLASGGTDRTLRGWDWKAGRERFVSHGHYGPVLQVAWSPDGKTIATSGRSGEFAPDRRLRFWDAATGGPRETVSGDQRPLESIALSPDGKLAAAGSVDTSLSLWDVTSGRLLRRWKQQEAVAFSRVAFSPDGKTLAANGSTDVFLWKVPSGQLVGQINGIGEHIRCVRFTPDGKSVVASDVNGGIMLADVAGLRVERKFSPPEGRAFNDETWSLAFTPDGKILASGGWQKKLILWDVASGRALRHFKDHGKYVRSVAVSFDGRMVASGSDEETVVVREVATGRVMHTLNSPAGAVALAFTPDCRTLIGGNYYNEVYLWDLATAEGDRFATLAGHFGGWVTELACAPDGEFVAAASSDSTALLWDLPAAYEQRTEQVVRASDPAELKKAWDMLSDASTADRGLWQLVESAPESIAFLAGQLKPAKADTNVLAEVPKLIADLDAGQFKVRERAAERLWEIGPPARPLMEEALRGKLSYEQRSRIRRMLRDFAAPPDALLDSPEELAKVRAVYVLEHIGTEPARDLLQRIAESPQNTAERHNAKAALERLATREVK